MRERRNRMFILGLLAFILILSGAYALFATNIAGTAGGATEFKIEFVDYTSTNEEKSSVDVDATRTTMSITADLSYPGDTVTINFIIKNTGRLNATVNDLVINENSTEDFNVNIVGLSSILGTSLAPDATTEGSIVVTWNSASTIKLRKV